MSEWRRCSEHPDVNGATMWGCPDCLAFLRRDVGKLQADLAQAQQERDGARAALDKALHPKIAAEQQLSSTRAALAQIVQYAEHKNGCRLVDPYGRGQCSCGLAELRDRLAALGGQP